MDPHGTSADPIEVEWQFDAWDLRPVERWLSNLPTQQLAGPGGDFGDLEGPTPDGLDGQVGSQRLIAVAKPARRLVDRYLDTEEWRVGRAGYVLRTRRRGKRDEATLKDLQPASEQGLRRRVEVTQDLGEQGIDALDVHGPVGWRVRAMVGRAPLRQVLEVRTRRRPFSLQVSGQEVAELALDETMIILDDHESPARLRRVEVEVDPAWAPIFEPFVEELARSCGLRPAMLSKFEAGLLAKGWNLPTEPELGSLEITSASTFGELAYAVLRRQVIALLRHEPGTRLGEDPEELHDMRVATRRLRAGIDLFEDTLPARAATLRRELGWLAGVLGAVRDLDVQLEGASDSAVPAWLNQPDDAAVSPDQDLRALLERQWSEARRDLLVALDATRYSRLVTGLQRMVESGAPRRIALARTPAVVMVPDLIEKRHRTVAKAARRAHNSGTPAAYHQLRIKIKKLRYSIEFAAELYESCTRRYSKQITRLQDELGSMQDAEVASERLRRIATDATAGLQPATVFALGAVADRYQVEAARTLAKLPKRLKVLRGPEWRQVVALMERRRSRAMEETTTRPRRPAAGSGESAEERTAETRDPNAPVGTETDPPRGDGHDAVVDQHETFEETPWPPPPVPSPFVAMSRPFPNGAESSHDATAAGISEPGPSGDGHSDRSEQSPRSEEAASTTASDVVEGSEEISSAGGTSPWAKPGSPTQAERGEAPAERDGDPA